MDLPIWFMVVTVLFAAVQAGHTVDRRAGQGPGFPEGLLLPNQLKRPQRYETKEVILYLTPTQIRALESGQGLISPQPTVQTEVINQNQEQKQEVQNILNEQGQQVQKEIENLETDKKQDIQLQEPVQNAPTKDENIQKPLPPDNTAHKAEELKHRYSELRPQVQFIPRAPANPENLALSLGKPPWVPNNYAYLYFYPKGKPQDAQKIQVFDPELHNNRPNEQLFLQSGYQDPSPLNPYLHPKFQLVPYAYSSEKRLEAQLLHDQFASTVAQQLENYDSEEKRQQAHIYDAHHLEEPNLKTHQLLQAQQLESQYQAQQLESQKLQAPEIESHLQAHDLESHLRAQQQESHLQAQQLESQQQQAQYLEPHLTAEQLESHLQAPQLEGKHLQAQYLESHLAAQHLQAQQLESQQLQAQHLESKLQAQQLESHLKYQQLESQLQAQQLEAQHLQTQQDELHQLQTQQDEVQQILAHQLKTFELRPPQMEIHRLQAHELELDGQFIEQLKAMQEKSHLEAQRQHHEIKKEEKQNLAAIQMDVHHEAQQLEAEQAKALELNKKIEAEQLKAHQLKSHLETERLKTQIESSKFRIQELKAHLEAQDTETENFKSQEFITHLAEDKVKSSSLDEQKLLLDGLEQNKDGSNTLLLPLLQHQNNFDLFNQKLKENEPKLEGGFKPLEYAPKYNTEKYTKEVEKILIKNNAEKQNALAKAAAIANESPIVIEKDVKVSKRPLNIIKEVKVPTPYLVPYPKPVEVKVPVPYAVPIQILNPVPIPIVQMQKVEVEKPVPIEVEKIVQVPVTKNVYVKVDKPYFVERIVPVEITKKIPVISKPQKFTIVRHVWKH